MGIYIGYFENKEEVFQEFACSAEEAENCRILLAWYGQGSYDGSAFVLFTRDGMLYEVNGGHCSCYGLEDQWEPELTSIEALKHRINVGELGQDTYYDYGVFDQQLLGILDSWNLIEFVQYGEAH